MNQTEIVRCLSALHGVAEEVIVKLLADADKLRGVVLASEAPVLAQKRPPAPVPRRPRVEGDRSTYDLDDEALRVLLAAPRPPSRLLPYLSRKIDLVQVTNLVARLERKGLVARKHGKTHITELGRQRIGQVEVPPLVSPAAPSPLPASAKVRGWSERDSVPRWGGKAEEDYKRTKARTDFLLDWLRGIDIAESDAEQYVGGLTQSQRGHNYRLSSDEEGVFVWVSHPLSRDNTVVAYLSAKEK